MVTGTAGVFYLGVQSVSPAGSGNASNGLSIDGTSGDVVLGNDVGDPGQPAALLNDREIPTDGHSVILQDSITTFTTFAPGSIEIDTANSISLFNESVITLLRTNPGQVIISESDGIDEFRLVMDGAGGFTFEAAGSGVLGGIDLPVRNWRLGQVLSAPAFNGAKLEVTGSLTSDLFVDGGGGLITIDEDHDKGKVFTNAGGVTQFDLPPNPVEGFHVIFLTVSDDNVTVQASPSESLMVSNIVGVLGGSATVSKAGSALHLIYCQPNAWVAVSVLGPWYIL